MENTANPAMNRRSQSEPTLWEIDSELFGPPKTGARPDSRYASPQFESQDRKRQAPRRVYLAQRRRLRETVADPEELSSEAERISEAYKQYFAGGTDARRGGDPRLALPECDDLSTLADTFGASREHLAQAERMRARGLRGKSKRLLLCGLIGHRVNCSESPDHRFCQPYMCRCRYCVTCGPAWFREKFSDLVFTLEPVIDHLLDESRKRGRSGVIAKVDFTVPNTGTMPTSEKVREFHRDMHAFWRLVERACEITGKDYGQAGCDEFGGRNSNLHRHSLYVGPELPQRRKELSALWSIAGLRGARRREMLRFIRKDGLQDAWRELAPHERRFVSIKRARSFRAALAHALKYPAKFLSASTPERLAELEVAFHRTRRFSSGGAFYKLKVTREPGEDSPIGSCPLCGARLYEVVEPWVSRFVLEAEGRRDVEQVRREVARAKVFSGSDPP